MSTPHKHAAVIKAWADGAQVELQNSSGAWSIVGRPYFDAKFQEYRVYDPLREFKDAYARGEKVEVYHDGRWQCVTGVTSCLYHNRPNILFCVGILRDNPLRIAPKPKPDYKETGILQHGGKYNAVVVTVDGTTGQPKSVELVK